MLRPLEVFVKLLQVLKELFGCGKPPDAWKAFVKVCPEDQHAVQSALLDAGVGVNHCKYRAKWGFAVLGVYATESRKEWILTIPGVLGVNEGVAVSSFDTHPRFDGRSGSRD